MVIQKNRTDSADIAARFLKDNKIVILPTDTIYGFSGIVPTSASSIHTAKGRDEGKPFIELIAHADELALYSNEVINPKLLSLWPGAVTLIVKNKSGGTTAFRCPGDTWLREVIQKTGAPIFSTSVNKAGEPALKNIESIQAEFGTIVDLIVDDGNFESGLASTLIDTTGPVYRVIRQGSVIVTTEHLQRLS